ncbi:MAG: flavin reductase family protein [Bulleidia sp.]
MTRTDLGSKPFLYPMPVLIIGTYDENGTPNAMNAAWGMITDYHEITISLSEHKTTQNLRLTGAFTVSMGTEETYIACDYVGIESANRVPDKFTKAGFHAEKSTHVNAPLIRELPLTLECTVKTFEDDILVGTIVNVSADDSIMTDGTVDYTKLKPITYDPCANTYIGLGGIIGKAFKDGMKLKD